MTQWGRRTLAGVLFGAALLLCASPAAGATPQGAITGIEPDNGSVTVTFQGNDLPDDATIDPATVRISVDGNSLNDVKTTALAGAKVPRFAILAFDNSQSMKDKLVNAKAAADLYLNEVPDQVRVGLVTFGQSAAVKIQPTLDHEAVRAAVDAITVDAVTGTVLYDGVVQAIGTAGSEGVRSVLVLTDGRNVRSSATKDEAVAAVASSGASLSAVYLGSGAVPDDLAALVDGVGGEAVKPEDSAQLAQIFAGAARSLSTQVQVTAKLPIRFAGTTADLSVSAVTDSGIPLSDRTSYGFPKRPVDPAKFGPQPVTVSDPLIDESLLPVALGALFLGLLTFGVVAFSTATGSDRTQGRVRRRLSLYTTGGRPSANRVETSTALGSSQVARSAVELAGRVVQRRDFEGDLSRRLEAAGVPLRAAEWMLIHIGVALSLSFLLLLVSGGAILPTAVGLLLGLAGPWLYLSFKESRRTAAFLGQLPDTLQLVAGSLSAGYAMAQAIDTVVREGQQPITGEFNRALIEARLGVPIEDALEGVAQRMQSKDFGWVVMAIRIQREVGGNLAELLTTVSGTLRERERLRRQVKVLSAEGRLSAWILGLLPPAFSLYLLLVRPVYLKPLVTDPLGWLMLSVGLLLLVVGAAWMTKAVKVEV